MTTLAVLTSGGDSPDINAALRDGSSLVTRWRLKTLESLGSAPGL